MVTFVCEYCDKTLKKKQVEGHIKGRCSPGAMICIDCSKTFYGNDHKHHITCISEQEKHWGEFAPAKKTKQIAKEPIKQNKVAHHTHDLRKKSENNLQESNQNKQQQRKKSQKVQQQNNKSRKGTDKMEDQKMQNIDNQWKGWKNQIKSVIKLHEGKIQKGQLIKKVKKIYKQKAEQKLTPQQFEQQFNQKVQKIKNIKQVTYYELE